MRRVLFLIRPETLGFWKGGPGSGWHGPEKGGTHVKHDPPESIPVVKIGNDMPLSGQEKHLWKKQALAWLLGEGNIRGQARIASTNTPVTIEREGVKEAVRRAGVEDESELRVIGHVPELLEQARLKATERADGKVKRRRESVIAFHHYYAPAEINGRMALAHLPVMETDRGNVFYD